MRKHTFNKRDRLSSRKTIEKLLVRGNYFVIYPFKIYWMFESEYDSIVKFAISIPKRKFKKAVTRNLIKRRTIEAYRKQKNAFYQTLQTYNKKIALFLIYTSDHVSSYSEIEKIIEVILQKLIRSIPK